jgi:hypothetical protein
MPSSNPLFAALTGGLDLTRARVVEVTWDPVGRSLWINTEDGCVGRIYNVEKFSFRSPAQVGEE